MKRICFYAVLVVLAVGVVLPVNAQSTNLLQNPGFDSETYTLIATDPLDPYTTYNAPMGWWGGFIPPQTWGETWRNAFPAGYPHSAGLKRSGTFSFNMARGGATFTAWIYQQVSVQPDTDLQGGAWAFLENPVDSLVRAGIDPNGGTDVNSPSIVWSSFSNLLYQWNYVSVNAHAQGGTVTLFLMATQNAPGNPNGVYWDEAFLNGTPGSGVIQSGAPAAAIPPGSQVVTSTVRLNVRSGAGTNYDRIGRMNPGDAYLYIGEIGDWLQIDYNGQTGFVSAQYAAVSTGSPSASGAVGGAAVAPADALDFTVSYALRMRAAPNTTSATLATIPFTTVVKAVGRTADGHWLQVIYEGQTGWVATRYGRLSDDVARLPITG